MNTLHVKKGDTVKVLAGKSKGKTGKISLVLPKDGKVVVDGCNIMTKHIKPRKAGDPGGIQQIAAPLDASNVQVVCPSCNASTRVAKGVDKAGKKIRVCKKCGASLDEKKAEKKPAKKAAKKSDTETAAESEVKETKPVKKTAAKKAPAKKPAEKAEETKAPEADEQGVNE